MKLILSSLQAMAYDLLPSINSEKNTYTDNKDEKEVRSVGRMRAFKMCIGDDACRM